MIHQELLNQFVPMFDPIKAVGTISVTVRRKKDIVKKNGKNSLYIDLYQNRKRRKYFLNLETLPEHWDDKNGVFVNKAPYSKQYNMIIKQKLAAINKIMINYELANRPLKVEHLVEELHSPTFRLDFHAYALKHLESEKEFIAAGTYRQLTGQLNKIKEILPELTFADINHATLETLVKECKKRKNTHNTIYNTKRAFKKYLRKANKEGIHTELTFEDIKLSYRKTKFQFCSKEEIVILNEYLNNKFTPKRHKPVLKQFLFCCFTGLRFSDMQLINRESIMGDTLLFSSKKSHKVQRIKIIKAAQQYINDEGPLFDTYLTNQKTNANLKVISNLCELDKKLTFHISRHTFATQYIINGGDVVSLQQLLGHSNIKETMTYAHAVQSMMDSGMDNLESILKGDGL